jgi:hypothetical protein
VQPGSRHDSQVVRQIEIMEDERGFDTRFRQMKVQKAEGHRVRGRRLNQHTRQ